MKIEHRCQAVYVQPKNLFYRHINSLESVRLMLDLACRRAIYVTGLTNCGSLKSCTGNPDILKGYWMKSELQNLDCDGQLKSEVSHS